MGARTLPAVRCPCPQVAVRCAGSSGLAPDGGAHSSPGPCSRGLAWPPRCGGHGGCLIFYVCVHMSLGLAWLCGCEHPLCALYACVNCVWVLDSLAASPVSRLIHDMWGGMHAHVPLILWA